MTVTSFLVSPIMSLTTLVVRGTPVNYKPECITPQSQACSSLASYNEIQIHLMDFEALWELPSDAPLASDPPHFQPQRSLLCFQTGVGQDPIRALELLVFLSWHAPPLQGASLLNPFIQVSAHRSQPLIPCPEILSSAL